MLKIKDLEIDFSHERPAKPSVSAVPAETYTADFGAARDAFGSWARTRDVFLGELQRRYRDTLPPVFSIMWTPYEGETEEGIRGTLENTTIDAPMEHLLWTSVLKGLHSARRVPWSVKQHAVRRIYRSAYAGELEELKEYADEIRLEVAQSDFCPDDVRADFIATAPLDSISQMLGTYEMEDGWLRPIFARFEGAPELEWLSGDLMRQPDLPSDVIEKLWSRRRELNFDHSNIAELPNTPLHIIEEIVSDPSANPFSVSGGLHRETSKAIARRGDVTEDILLRILHSAPPEVIVENKSCTPRVLAATIFKHSGAGLSLTVEACHGFLWTAYSEAELTRLAKDGAFPEYLFRAHRNTTPGVLEALHDDDDIF